MAREGGRVDGKHLYEFAYSLPQEHERSVAAGAGDSNVVAALRTSLLFVRRYSRTLPVSTRAAG